MTRGCGADCEIRIVAGRQRCGRLPLLCLFIVTMTPEEQSRMNKLCQQIAVEQDPQTFGELVHQLNELLERKEDRLQLGERDNPHGDSTRFAPSE